MTLMSPEEASAFMIEGAWHLQRNLLGEIKETEILSREACQLLSQRRHAFNEASRRADEVKATLRSAFSSGEASWKRWRDKVRRAEASSELVSQAVAVQDAHNKRLNQAKQAYVEGMTMIKALCDVECMVLGKRRGPIQSYHLHVIGWMLANVEELERKGKEASQEAHEEVRDAALRLEESRRSLELARSRLHGAVTSKMTNSQGWGEKMARIKRASKASIRTSKNLRSDETRKLAAEERVVEAESMQSLATAFKIAIERVEWMALDVLGPEIREERYRRGSV